MIDSHTHLCDERFNDDLWEVIERAQAAGVYKFILPAADDKDHQRIAEIAQQYPDVAFATVGLHPTSVNDNPEWETHLRNVKKLLKNPPVRYIAIGETGVDLHWSHSFLQEQKIAFHKQVELSLEYHLPLIIHSRDAWEDTFEVLESYGGKAQGVIHSFSGGRAEVERLERLGGFYYGINGTVTFKNSTLPDALEVIPLEKILLETDSPYLTPVPYRGQRNQSEYIPLIAERIAQLKGTTVSTVSSTTDHNAATLFDI